MYIVSNFSSGKHIERFLILCEDFSPGDYFKVLDSVDNLYLISFADAIIDGYDIEYKKRFDSK